MTQYTQTFTAEEVFEAHKLFEERRDVYKKAGLDFLKSREFILGNAGNLQGKILEIGSGRGMTALALAKAGHILTSIDSDEEMLKVAALNLAFQKLLNNVKFHLMDAYSLDFDDNGFSTVFMIEALHHMNDIEGLFSEIIRVTSPGAKLVLADFNEKGRTIIENVHAKEGRVHVSSSLGKDETETWLSGHGFKIETYENTCHWLIISEKL